MKTYTTTDQMRRDLTMMTAALKTIATLAPAEDPHTLEKHISDLYYYQVRDIAEIAVLTAQFALSRLEQDDSE